MRKHLVAFVIVFGWTAGSASGQTSAAGALADAFVDAWNTHDVRAFGRLYADDADWVTVGGEDTRVASQSKAYSRRSTPVGLARRFFARRALPFGRSIPKMQS
jgi:hypothetical protein